MASLAIFDFDRTIVDEDSDATIIKRLTEKKPPAEWESSNYDWTPYMSNVRTYYQFNNNIVFNFTILSVNVGVIMDYFLLFLVYFWENIVYSLQLY